MDENSRPMAYEFADFRLDVRKRLLLLKKDHRPLPLSARAFDALLFFLEHPDELLEKSRLMAAIWPQVVVDENNLNQHISILRRTLGERPEEHRFIVTVPGRGYRFVAAVTAVATSASVTEPDSAHTAAASPHAAPSDARVTDAPAHDALTQGPRVKPTFSPLGPAGLLGIGALMLVLALVWYLTQLASRPAGPAVVTPTIPSVEVVPVQKLRLAVLPFENLSPDPSNAFFADGLHEEIVSTVGARMPDVEVISRTTMMSYRDHPPKPLAQVARELRVSHLIEGSVRREANKIRLTLQLIDARTDGHIWSASYDRMLADALTLQSQVAEEVAGQLSARLTHPEHPRTLPIRDTEAFDLYLKAVLSLRTFRGEPAQFHEIEGLLARAIVRDPSYALAYAQRARARTLVFIASRDTSEAFVSQIRADLDIAHRLAPQDPYVLAANGYFLMCANDTTGALEAYAAAEAAGLAEPEWLIPKAHLLLRRSRLEELNSTLQRMLALGPADPLVIHFAAYHYWRARQPLNALQAVEYARTAFPVMYASWRAYIMHEFGGRTAELRSYLENYTPTNDRARLDDRLVDYFTLQLFEHQYAQLRARIDRIPEASGNYYSGVEVGPIGPTPTALFRGWVDLLLEDRAGASKDGRAVLQFVERQTRNAWNGVHLETLAAAGYAFQGKCERARTAAGNALSLVSHADNAIIWTRTALQVAHINAWCGAQDEAVSLLEQVATGQPGFGPALISRDPLLTVPLGKLPAYRALSDQLEKAISATRLD